MRRRSTTKDTQFMELLSEVEWRSDFDFHDRIVGEDTFFAIFYDTTAEDYSDICNAIDAVPELHTVQCRPHNKKHTLVTIFYHREM